MEEKPELFICECHSTNHQLVFMYDDDDNRTYVHVYLTTWKNPFRRIWVALKYIFGYKSRYGAWDEFILNPKDVVRLKEHLDKLK